MANLGRLNPSAWLLFKWDVQHSFYLEPLDQRARRRVIPPGTKPSPNMTLANEIFLSTRGQYAFDRRVIPNIEQVAGGVYSARLSRIGFGRRFSLSRHGRVSLPFSRIRAPRPQHHKVPRQALPFSRPSSLTAALTGTSSSALFVDVGQPSIARRSPTRATRRCSARGVGLGFQFQQNLSIRGLGVEVRGIQGQEPVNSGYSRVNFILTVLY